MTEIKFVVNPKKYPPHTKFQMSNKSRMEVFLGTKLVTGIYHVRTDEATIYLFNVWKAFKKRYKGKTTLVKLITQDIEHEFLHGLLCRISIPIFMHEYAFDAVGIGHQNKSRLYE